MASNNQSTGATQQGRPRFRVLSMQEAPPYVNEDGETEHGRHKRAARTCFCFLLIPFLLAFVVSVVCVITFSIENEKVKRNCGDPPNPFPCMLNCDEELTKPSVYCWFAIGGEAAVSVVCALFIMTLVIRICYGHRV